MLNKYPLRIVGAPTDINGASNRSEAIPYDVSEPVIVRTVEAENNEGRVWPNAGALWARFVFDIPPDNLPTQDDHDDKYRFRMVPNTDLPTLEGYGGKWYQFLG